MTNKIYIERYNRLIKYCKNRTLNDEEYSEIHHIIPRCMSGDNGATNLIRLSAKEHYLAHWMLWKAYGTPGLVGAFFMMMVKNTQQDRRIMPSYLYEKLRKEMSKIASERGKTKQWITDG